MNTNLPISFIFLDTTEYVSCNFSYENELFRALKNRIDNKQVCLLITEITKNEVRNKIIEGVSNAKSALQSSRKEAKILWNSVDYKDSSLFKKFDSQSIQEELLTQFDTFLTEFSVENIGYENLNIEKIFSLYFSKKAPFGKMKKKHEFPDAFFLEMLDVYGETEQSDIYVVSNDQDVKQGVTNFHNLQYFSSFVTLLSHLTFKYEELAPLTVKVFEYARKEINDKIESYFSYLGFYIEDQRGDVNDISDIQIEKYEPTILSIENEAAETNIFAEFEVIVAIEFKADISYDDLLTASYDSEDKILIPHRIIEESVSSTEIIQLNVTINYQVDSPPNYKITEIVFSGIPDDIAVSSSENEGW